MENCPTSLYLCKYLFNYWTCTCNPKHRKLVWKRYSKSSGTVTQKCFSKNFWVSKGKNTVKLVFKVHLRDGEKLPFQERWLFSRFKFMKLTIMGSSENDFFTEATTKTGLTVYWFTSLKTDLIFFLSFLVRPTFPWGYIYTALLFHRNNKSNKFN